MSSIILNEGQVVKLIEYAIDIHRYREPIQYSKGNENEDVKRQPKILFQF